MAYAFMREWAENVIQTRLTNVRIVLVNNTHVHSQALTFLSEITSGERVALASSNLSNPTYANGVFDADDFIFSSINNGTIVGFYLVEWTGVEATSRLVAWYDGFSQGTNGGPITVQFNASGGFKLVA